MVKVNVILNVRNADDVEQVRELLAEHGRRSRAEPGCLRFEIYHSRSDPAVFILNEHWESEQLLDTHREAAACKEIYFPRVIPLVERTPHVCDLVE
jgi:quinol monooxygenase YgiN